jgi:hypothetical protein
MNPLTEKLIIAAVVVAAAGFAALRILRLVRGKRPDCCAPGGKAVKKTPGNSGAGL